MTEHERPLLADLQDQLGAVATDLGAMLALRWDLARSELRLARCWSRRQAVEWRRRVGRLEARSGPLAARLGCWCPGRR